MQVAERLKKFLVYSGFSVPPLAKALVIIVLLVNIIGIYITFNMAIRMMNSFPVYVPSIFNDAIKAVLLSLILYSCGFGIGIGIIAGAFIECLRSKKLRESLGKAKDISASIKNGTSET